MGGLVCSVKWDQVWMAKETSGSQNSESFPTTPSFSLIDLTRALRMCASRCVVTQLTCRGVDTGFCGDGLLTSPYELATCAEPLLEANGRFLIRYVSFYMHPTPRCASTVS